MIELASNEFEIDLNLDDDTKRKEFLAKYGTQRGRRLANALGFSGRGAVKAANALSNYAWNKETACSLRLAGNIPTALSYEAICDRIYSQDIQPNIVCW